MTEEGKSREDDRPSVVIFGASGFVGRALAAALGGRFRVFGVSRRPRGSGATTKAESEAGDGFAGWRSADLFNLRETEEALRGARYAVYLVHSMVPSARLTQGAFQDMDLICADNFARAARHAGVEHVVYLGGLIPEGAALSPHLQSRLEVEATLARSGVPFTGLRAGLVLGHGGSSFEILVRLVERLPAMILPRWTSNEMQPIAIDDVVAQLAFVLGRNDCFGETFDVGAPQSLRYRDLIALCAELLGVRRPLVPVRYFAPKLSRLWVSLVTGAPRALVDPLVESLAHPMVARDLRLASRAGIVPRSVRDALAGALRQRRGAPRDPFQSAASGSSASLVRSVQRMRLPTGRDAAWAADEYMRWLEVGLRGLVRVDVKGHHVCHFTLAPFGLALLELTHEPLRSSSDRQLFFVTGGILVRRGQRGRFELRQVAGTEELVTAIHDYGPRLPWFLYRMTQAKFHAWVMRRFARHLGRTPPMMSALPPGFAADARDPAPRSVV